MIDSELKFCRSGVNDSELKFFRSDIIIDSELKFCRSHMDLVEECHSGVSDYLRTRPKPVGIGTDPRMEPP